MANVWALLSGVFGLVASGEQIKKGLGLVGEKTTAGIKAEKVQVKSRVHRVKNIDERVGYIVKLIRAGKIDPRVKELAAKILTRKDKKGRWVVPEKDWQAEVSAIFYAVRRRIRYTHDAYGVDQFAAAKRSLQWHIGDCLPLGTLLVKRPGVFVPIEEIQPGDYILDGLNGWVRVTNWWEKGILPVRIYRLNNGSVLRCTADHRLFVVPRRTANLPGRGEDAIEVVAKEVDVGDDLLQPIAPLPCGQEGLNPDIALIIGAYIAEGWTDYKNGKAISISIAGIPDSKGLRERVIAAAERLGLPCSKQHKQIRLGKEALQFVQGCGARASEKRLPHLNFDLDTLKVIIEAMEQGDGGLSTHGNMVYSTISPLLALQYRLAQRMLGHSCHVKCLVKHGGLGKHPIYRITVCQTDGVSRPWAKVKAIEDGGEAPVFDIETETGRIYLPESDVVTHNCDDACVVLGSLLQAVGYPVRLRVVQTKDSDDWDHIYLLVRIPPMGEGGRWHPLDASVDKQAGWEVPRDRVAKIRDYEVPV